MSFVSHEFFVFLALTFVLYHAVGAIWLQNFVILIASYVFYAWWDWRFLPLLIGISIINYGTALLITASPTAQKRRALLVIAIVAAIAVLSIFKYFNFFIDSFGAATRIAGIAVLPSTIHITLPLGISFITFQGMAYVIDVYRGQHDAERNLIRFLAFKAFFPQLIAGPIERASNLLDQFSRPRRLKPETVDRALWLMIYGYAMKLLIADGMAPIVDSLFVKDQPFGWSVVLGTIAFGFQIYADFCGYSLIAKGIALLFGFELIWNFRFPYWAATISDFWRGWHISLSTWLRDYLYIPLGGNRHGELATARNLLITMALGGLWHGASWTFVLWGLLHGIALATWRFSPALTLSETWVGRALSWAITMVVVFIGWFLFRATSWELFLGMTGALGHWEWAPVHGAVMKALVVVGVPLFALEWLLRSRGDYFFVEQPRWLSYPVYAVLAVVALAAAGHQQVSFIYFQF
jgi:alginate O-acetyltransferase complex protein AlgI